MSPKTAQKIFIFLVIIAIPLTLWPFWELWTIFKAIKNSREIVVIDSGIFYLWLMSVFFTFYLIQRKGLQEHSSLNTRHASLAIVIQFLVITIVAYSLPIALKHWLIENQYQLCIKVKKPGTITDTTIERYSLSGCE
ncbi:hypothetical protein NBRC116493_13710 [Aurantivibrio infirmus]